MKFNLDFKDLVIVIVIIIAAVLAAGLSIYQHIESSKKDKEIAEKTKELIIQQKEIIKIQNETIKNILGDGYIEVKPIIENENLKFILETKSNYNIYDVHFEIINFDDLKICGHEIVNDTFYFTEECYTKNSYRNRIDILSPNNWVDSELKKRIELKDYNFIIKVISRNLTTIQYLTLNIDSNKRILYGSRLYEVSRSNLNYILLSKSKDTIKEEVWEKLFPYKKNFNVKR